MAPAHRTDTAQTPTRRISAGHMRTSGPALPIASVVAGAAGLACGYLVSWIACIALGIVAVALGMVARRKQASPTWAATLGVVLGGICIVASFALVAVVSFQMIRLGLVS